MDIIDNERMKILEEKAKIETTERLRTNSMPHSNRNEIDESIKIAQEACRQSDIEREKYIDLQYQCELKRRELINAESSIRAKQSEFEIKIIEMENEKVNHLNNNCIINLIY